MLTTPVVGVLSKAGYEVHFLSKAQYAEILLANPRIDRVWTIEDKIAEVLSALQEENFYKVLDLHDNLRSVRVRKTLGVPTAIFDKQKVSNFLWTKFGLKTSASPSILSRFLKTAEGLDGVEASAPLEFPIPPKTREAIEKYELPSKYYCIAVGAAWKTKQLPLHKIQEVLDGLPSENIILLGGPKELYLTKGLTLGPKVRNLVGQLSIIETGAIIERATALLSGDTGVMHIAAALGTPIVAIFGSTHPDMGYAPYSKEGGSQPVLIQHESLECRPCTKHGKKSCPKGHFKCMEELDMAEVVEALSVFGA